MGYIILGIASCLIAVGCFIGNMADPEPAILITSIVFFGVMVFSIIKIFYKVKDSEITLPSGFSERLRETGFIVNKEQICGLNRLYIDDVNKKWLLREPRDGSTFKIYDFADLINFEVFEDGDSIAEGRAGSALVGGLLLGTVGAVVGASGSRNIKNTCNTLQLRIRVNDISKPERVIDLIRKKTLKTSYIYKERIEQCRAIAGSLSYIQNNTKSVVANTIAPTQIQPQTIESNTSITQISEADEILKFKKLKDEGIITETEFEEKKKQLLGL